MGMERIKETQIKCTLKKRRTGTLENIPSGQSSTISVLFTKCFKELTYILTCLPIL